MNCTQAIDGAIYSEVAFWWDIPSNEKKSPILGDFNKGSFGDFSASKSEIPIPGIGDFLLGIFGDPKSPIPSQSHLWIY